MSSISNRNRYPFPTFGNGWIREEITRQNGISRGKIDIYYYSPSGKKFRSKPDLARFMGSAVDLTAFNYHTGQFVSDKNKLQKMRQSSSRNANRMSPDTSLPIRQTASVFKQAVTKRTNHKNVVKFDGAKTSNSAPQQLFKEKRLAGLNVTDVAEAILMTIDLPKSLQAIGPDQSQEALLRRIATQLHQGGPPITGQTSNSVVKDPTVWLNAQQPLCKAFVVTEVDIQRQEDCVKRVRHKLELALKHSDQLQHQELLITS